MASKSSRSVFQGDPMYKTLVLFVLFGMIFPTVTQAEGEKSPRTITTTGESIVYVVPDEVIVNFGVETYDPRLDRAKSDNDRMSAQLVSAIRELKVEEK